MRPQVADDATRRSPEAKDVSVVIPTFNRAHYLPYTLDSVLGQSHPVKEVIVVDDGSTDNTQTLLESSWPEVKVIRICNSGPSTARNVGVRASQAHWIAFCDSDDLWNERKVEKQLELLRHCPDIEYCFTNFSFLTGDEWSRWNKFQDLPADYWPEGTTRIGNDHLLVSGTLYRQILRVQPIFPSTVLMTREFFERIGGFNEKFSRTATEDFEFTLRCVQEQPIGVTFVPLVAVRIHGEKHSGDPLANALGQADILQFALQHHRGATPCAAEIRERILVSRLDALYAAFERGRYDLFNELYGKVPPHLRDTRLFAKALISRQPPLLRRALFRLIRGLHR